MAISPAPTTHKFFVLYLHRHAYLYLYSLCISIYTCIMYVYLYFWLCIADDPRKSTNGGFTALLHSILFSIKKEQVVLLALKLVFVFMYSFHIIGQLAICHLAICLDYHSLFFWLLNHTIPHCVDNNAVFHSNPFCKGVSTDRISWVFFILSVFKVVHHVHSVC